VPAEAIRLQRRLSARDRWFIALLALGTLVGCAAVLLAGRADSGSGTAATPCVTVIRASWMGGASFRYCGADAVAYCKRSAASDRQLAAQCARLEPEAASPD
jgi:hypothetical protein